MAPADAMLPVPGWADLTDTQRMVAELVMDGLTNREIAQTLFVSTKTVETHLRAAFRKLGVGSRQELSAVLADA